MQVHVDTNETLQPDASAVRIEPYEIRVDDQRRGCFDNLRDAIASAKLLRRDRPFSRITVSDASSGAFVIEVD